MKISLNNQLKQKGFTVIELMIATTIFSGVLLIITENIISISGNYYQGLIQTQTLNTTKNIIQTLTQDLQLNISSTPIIPDSANRLLWNNTFPPISGNPSDINNYEFCSTIGDHVYIYQLGGYVVNGSTTPSSSITGQASGALELYLSPDGCPDINAGSNQWNLSKKYNFTLPNSITAFDLVPENMRLVKFDISTIKDKNGYQVPKLFKIDVEVAYGDDNSFDIVKNVCKKGVYLCAHTEIVSYVNSQ